MAERDSAIPPAEKYSVSGKCNEKTESPKISSPKIKPTTSQPQHKSHSVNDFLFGKVLGEGSFSTVYLAKDVHTNGEYAIKVCDKQHMIQEKKAHYVTREKKALTLLANCPYIVKLYLTFQDTRSLYFVLTYARNGDLLQLIKKLGSFNLQTTKFYASQILIALESLKANEILHRDLKPENILLDDNFNILLTDFGSTKLLNPAHEDKRTNGQKPRKNSFVGTANYVAPELLSDEPVTYASDLWAYGCIIYQMLTGKLCFQAGSDYLIFNKILEKSYTYPAEFPNEAQDFIEKLLVINSEERLGATDARQYYSIREDEFFKGINWELLGPSPLIKCIDECDTSETDCFEWAKPGLGQDQMARLMGLHVRRQSEDKSKNVIPKIKEKSICDITPEELEIRLSEQRRSNKYHDLAEGNLILKQGFLEKKKGLIPRRRMFLLTLGPRIYYIEPNSMLLKGQIPWTEHLRVEVKNFTKFDIVTPNRTYILEDLEGFALEWRQVIQDIHNFYFNNDLKT